MTLDADTDELCLNMERKYRMSRTVCILTAGRGTRLGRMSHYINKSLVPVAYQPVFSRIIGKFSADTHFVIAVGYKADLVRDYMSIAHPQLDVSFVEVDNYEGENSGPGYSLLCCKAQLQEPFFLTTCDTLVDEDIPEVDSNWVGVAHHPRTEEYCSVGLNNEDFVVRIDYKEQVAGNVVFIGIAGIYDINAFWDALESDQRLIYREYQIANGLQGLLDYGLKGCYFTWHDTGSIDSWQETNSCYGTDFANFDKENEFLYFVNNQVVKFFADSRIAQARIARNRLLGHLCPTITASTANFYRYPFVEGPTLAEVVDDPTFERFLNWCQDELWLRQDLSPEELDDFHTRCRSFYKDKTQQRLDLFHEVVEIPDRSEIINGYQVDSTQSLMDRIDWDWLSDGVPVQFHGDLHFDNTVVPVNRSEGDFRLLDWRQDFCGLLRYGDWYYDLAKIHHELFISHKEIKRNAYEVNIEGSSVLFSYATRSELLSCQKIMRRFVQEVGLEYSRVLLLTHLIFLNMSPLHHRPFNLLLYYLGKLGLHQLLVEGYEML